MEKIKTTLDREQLSSESIRGKQDFNFILKEHQAFKPPIWKSAWFYGPVGIAMVTMVVASARLNPENDSEENLTASNTDASQVERAETPIFAINTETPAARPTPQITKETASTEITKSIPIPEEIIQKEPVIQPKEANIQRTSSFPAEFPVTKTSKNTMPSIAGVFTGRINVNAMCAAGEVTCNNDYEVISYDIHYHNGVDDISQRINGNKFPAYLCDKLKNHNVGGMVFFTNIVAQDPNGNIKRLISMNFEPTL